MITVNNIYYSNCILSKSLPAKLVKNASSYLCKDVENRHIVISITAGIGLTALVIGGILYGRTKKLPQFAQNIVFKEAKNLNEAMEFGKKNFSIEKYTGFAENDLDIINWINEGLVKINNKAKGRVHMPKNIIFQDDIKDAVASMNTSGEFRISKNSIDNAKYLCETIIERTTSCSEEEAEKMVSLKKPNEIFKMIGDFIKDYPDYQECMQAYQSDFAPIYHEMGHLQHFQNIGDRLNLSFNLGTGITPREEKLIKLFNNSQSVTSKVTPYAMESPNEFVAEVYSMMCDGVKLDADVMELYQKLGGVKI